MGKPAAKKGDSVAAIDTHIVMVPSPAGPIPTPMPHAFRGPLASALASTVLIEDKAAALQGSEADNMPPHIPTVGSFMNPPSNKATVQQGSPTVIADERPMARHGDPAITCNDPADSPNGRVIAASTVIVD